MAFLHGERPKLGVIAQEQVAENKIANTAVADSLIGFLETTITEKDSYPKVSRTEEDEEESPLLVVGDKV